MKTVLSVAAFFIWSVFFLSSAAADCREAANAAKRGAEAMEQNNTAKGVSLFLEAYQNCRQNPAYAFNLGMAYTETKNYPEAEKYLRVAVDQNGGNPVWLNNLARVMLENGKNPDDAVRFGKKACQLDPNNSAFHETLALAQKQAGDPQGAFETISLANRRWPNDSRISSVYAELESLQNFAFRTEVPLKNGQKSTASHDKTLAKNSDADIDIPPKGLISRPNSVALVIGNQRYADRNFGVPDVPFAENDAEIMEKYLVETLGYEKIKVFRRVNVTESELKRLLGTEGEPGQLENIASMGGVDEFFIYYSGHGHPPTRNGGPSYLVPVDADPQYININGYSTDRFKTVVARLNAQKTTVVLDACFSGRIAKDKGRFKNKKMTPLNENKVVHFLATQGEQVAAYYDEHSHGLFTYLFLKGLRGEADGYRGKRYDPKSRDRIVTVGEMEDYLMQYVPLYALQKNKSQYPSVVGGNPNWELTRFR